MVNKNIYIISHFNFYICHVVLPILLGGLIYISFRPTSLLMFKWFDNIGFEPALSAIREVTQPIKSIIPSWIIYTLPDCLWVYSLTICIARIWYNKSQILFILWSLIVGLLSVGSEIGQLLGFLEGTFDIVDLVLLSVSYSLALLIINQKKGSFKNEN